MGVKAGRGNERNREKGKWHTEGKVRCGESKREKVRGRKREKRQRKKWDR